MVGYLCGGYGVGCYYDVMEVGGELFEDVGYGFGCVECGF